MSRPITYDRDSVIELAARQFWQDGIGDCNVENITRRAKLNRHSLYKAFGGKSGLFRDAIEHYVTRISAPYLRMLETGTGLDDLVRYFDVIANNGGAGDQTGLAGIDSRGCLVANTVIALGRSDARVAAIVDRHYARIDRAFRGLVERGQAAGSIRGDVDAAATARWLLLTTQGISVAARLGDAPQDLPAIIRRALAPGPTPRATQGRGDGLRSEATLRIRGPVEPDSRDRRRKAAGSGSGILRNTRR